jgi:hypothetical protein
MQQQPTTPTPTASTPAVTVLTVNGVPVTAYLRHRGDPGPAQVLVGQVHGHGVV